MEPVPIVVLAYVCQRCGHTWVPRPYRIARADKLPRICPKCKSTRWQMERDREGTA